MKNYLLLLVFVILFFAQQLNTAEKEKYTFLYNSKLDMYSGAENVLSLYKLTGRYEDKLLEKIKWNEDTILNRIAGIGFRLAKISFWNVRIGDWFIMMQDVYFGNGARLREYSIPVKYKITNIWTTYSWNYTIDWSNVSDEQKLGIISGGPEGRQVIAQTARLKCLEEDNYKWYEIVPIAGQFDTSFFIFFNKYSSDVREYKWRMSRHYLNYYVNITYSDYEEIYSYTVNDMQKGAWWNLCDPLLLYTMFYGGYKYIVYDQKTFKNPMIKITDDVSFLPGTKYNLTPIGGDYYLYGYLKVFKKLFVAYYREGGDKYSTASGLGFSGNNIIDSGKISLNASFDYWNQPEFIYNVQHSGNWWYYYPNKTYPEYKRGFNGEFMATYKLNDVLSLNYGFGYKDIGYLIGKPYNKGAYSYAGFTVSF